MELQEQVVYLVSMVHQDLPELPELSDLPEHLVWTEHQEHQVQADHQDLLELLV